MDTFGHRLRFLRESLGLTQEQLAKKMILSKSSINMYERNEREPSFATLYLMADYFNVEMDYLLGTSEYPTKSEWLISREESNVFPALTISPEAQAVAELYDRLDIHGQRLVRTVAQLEAERCETDFEPVP